jgi:hypothetical protein
MDRTAVDEGTVTILGFLELLQFGVMVAVFVSFTLAVSLCVAMILDYLRD